MVDGLPDPLRLALRPRVDAAHDALQFRELPDHVGREVGLREQRGAPGRGRRGGPAEDLAGDPLRQLRRPFRLGPVAAEPLVEEQGVEAIEPVLEPQPPVRVPEEASVAQAGHEHPLGVAGDPRDVVARHVGDGEEVRQEPSVGVDHREVVLVVHHGGREHLVGQIEELPRKRAGHHGRVLDQVGHLASQRGLILDRRRRASDLAGGGGELAGDAGTALAAVDQHVGARQPLPVVGERRHLDRLSRLPVAGEEAVPVGDVGGTDRGHAGRRRARRPADGERHDPAPEQEQQPTDGPAEEELAAPVVERGVPAHRLREREVAQGGGEDAAEHRAGGPAGLPTVAGEVLPLRGLDAGERGNVDALLAREAERGARGLPLRVEGGANRWAGDRLLQIGLSVRQLGHRRHQPPGADEGANRGAARDPRFCQTCRQPLGELRLEAGDPARRHLLAADLDQQLAIRHAHAPPACAVAVRSDTGPSPACPSIGAPPPATAAWSRSQATCASAIATASFRTRRM